MRKIVFKTFIIVLGLSIVPLKADAQFFKKLFGKKKEKEVERVEKAPEQQTVMLDPATLEDNSNNRNGFMGIPLGIDAEVFDKRMKELGFAAIEQKEKQTSKTYKYEGDVFGVKSFVTLNTSEKTNIVYAVDVVDPTVYSTEKAVTKRNTELKNEFVKTYGKGYVNKGGECYTIITQLGSVNLHYERITIGGGFNIGFVADDAKAYKVAYDEMADKDFEASPREIVKGLAPVCNHIDVVGVGVKIMEEQLYSKARTTLTKHDYVLGKATSKALTATYKLPADYSCVLTLGRKGSKVNTVTITANEDKDLVMQDLKRCGFEEIGKNTYKSGRLRLTWTEDKQGRQVLKFSSALR